MNDIDKIMELLEPVPAAELEARRRLEHLRGELRAERISYGELIELQNLAKYIEPGDVELLEAAGVPEFPEEQEPPTKPYVGTLQDTTGELWPWVR